MKKSKHALALLMSLMLLLTALGGCGRNKAETKPSDSPIPAESAEPSETATDPVREDGERFEAVIMIEGMEETIQLEHLRNATAGFEMDYDYESFVRQSEADRECFVWSYDDLENPENYVEVSYSAEDAETVAEEVSDALSKEYQTGRDAFTLDGAGDCIRINASLTADGSGTAEVLQTVYIIPAPDGCRVALTHYIAEGSDGFGKRLAYLVNTLTVTEAEGERRMSDKEALSAVKHYCYSGIPDLEHIVNDGEFPVYWDIQSSSEEEIVVLFRSYTAAQTRYYIDPVSGETYMTEFVPGIITEEQRMDETLNMWDYLDWWRS